MNPEDLQRASYRGIEFLVTTSSITGGRKDVKKTFIDSDLQLIEDLGLSQRAFTLSGIITARRNASGVVIKSYQEVRDDLLQALELGGVGVLVHPFYGRLENIVCRTFNFTEDMTRLGDSSIDITFEVSNATGLPQPKESVLGEVVSKNTSVVSSITTEIEEEFLVTEAYTGNFQDAIDKVESFIDAVNAAISPTAVEATKLDTFNEKIGDILGDLAGLVNDPASLSASMADLLETVASLYTSPEDTYSAFVRLFTFGDDDIGFSLDTAGRVERQENRRILNIAVQGIALGYAYESASEMDYQTGDQVDLVSRVLEDQYASLIEDEDLDNVVAEDLVGLRSATVKFFEDQKLSKPQIITVRTNLTSTRLLAYQYYGDSSLGESTIPELNGLADSAFVDGDVKILSA